MNLKNLNEQGTNDMDPQHMTALQREYIKLKNDSQKIYHRASKQPFEYAYRDWKTYRKVYLKQKQMKKKCALVINKK